VRKHVWFDPAEVDDGGALPRKRPAKQATS
jgi:hypothetical protein